jgi:hypothetical protein
LGNRKPVMLVRIVVTRKTAVRVSRRFALNIPNTTATPEPIAIRLMRTCTAVKVASGIPRIVVSKRNAVKLAEIRLATIMFASKRKV